MSTLAERRAGAAGRERCFFVQARYGEGWTTVAVGARRGVAIEYAADVYRTGSIARRGIPQQVRVISEGSLRAESGDASVRRAYHDVGAEADRILHRLTDPVA